MHNLHLNKNLVLEILKFCRLERQTLEAIKNRLAFVFPNFNVMSHVFLMIQLKIVSSDIWNSVKSVMSKEDTEAILERVVLCERNTIIYIKESVTNLEKDSNIRQQSRFERTLPNPNDIDIVRYSLSVVLESVPPSEVIFKCGIAKSDVSNLKAMKRSVSLDKAIEIAASIGKGEDFAELISKKMLLLKS